MRSFMKIKPSQNGKITLSFIDIGKSCLSHELFTSLICLLMLFREIKFLAKISESTVSFILWVASQNFRIILVEDYGQNYNAKYRP